VLRSNSTKRLPEILAGRFGDTHRTQRLASHTVNDRAYRNFSAAYLYLEVVYMLPYCQDLDLASPHARSTMGT
jgi:hypothetical protein